jgi:hypothetical protein
MHHVAGDYSGSFKTPSTAFPRHVEITGQMARLAQLRSTATSEIDARLKAIRDQATWADTEERLIAAALCVKADLNQSAKWPWVIAATMCHPRRRSPALSSPLGSGRHPRATNSIIYQHSLSS